MSSTPLSIQPSSSTLHAAGQAMNEEMRNHNCQGPYPEYEPHPAYDSFAALIQQLDAASIDPLSLLNDDFLRTEEDTPFRRNVKKCHCGFLEYLCHNTDSEGNSTCFFASAGVYQGVSDGFSGNNELLDIYNDGQADEQEYVFHEYDVDAFDAWEFVWSLETVEVASVAQEDMRCAICWDDFDDEMHYGRDTTPVEVPCCRRIFMRDCLIKALKKEDVHCPWCQRDIVRIARDQD